MRAAKEAGVEHFVWSTLPMSKRSAAASTRFPISPIRPRWTPSSRPRGSDYTFVVASFFYQNLKGALASNSKTARLDGRCRSTRGSCHSRRRHHRAREGGGRVRNPIAATANMPVVGDPELQRHRDDAQRARSRSLSTGSRGSLRHLLPGAGELAEMFGYFEDYTIGPEFRRPDRAGQQSRRNASNRFRHLGALEYAPKLRTVKQKPPAIGGCLRRAALDKPRMLVGGVTGNEVVRIAVTSASKSAIVPNRGSIAL